jgi:hypothetical protein
MDGNIVRHAINLLRFHFRIILHIQHFANEKDFLSQHQTNGDEIESTSNETFRAEFH